MISFYAINKAWQASTTERERAAAAAPAGAVHFGAPFPGGLIRQDETRALSLQLNGDFGPKESINYASFSLWHRPKVRFPLSLEKKNRVKRKSSSQVPAGQQPL
jgi:hypothetical protein